MLTEINSASKKKMCWKSTWQLTEEKEGERIQFGKWIGMGVG